MAPFRSAQPCSQDKVQDAEPLHPHCSLHSFSNHLQDQSHHWLVTQYILMKVLFVSFHRSSKHFVSVLHYKVVKGSTTEEQFDVQSLAYNKVSHSLDFSLPRCPVPLLSFHLNIFLCCSDRYNNLDVLVGWLRMKLKIFFSRCPFLSFFMKIFFFVRSFLMIHLTALVK